MTDEESSHELNENKAGAGWVNRLKGLTSLARLRGTKVSADHLNEHKSPDLRNGLFSKSGVPLFESPPQSLIEQLIVQDPGRVEYFRFRVPIALDTPETRREIDDNGEMHEVETTEKLRVAPPGAATYNVDDGGADAYRSINQHGIADMLFTHQLVVPELTQHIAEEFGGQTIGLRGTACSIDPHTRVLSDGIKNIHEILMTGAETSKNYTAMSAFNHEHPEISHRSVQWLISHPRRIRQDLENAGKTDEANKIFPVLLVYDRSKFPEGTTELQNDLPDSTQKRSEVILKAYILDMPIKQRLP